MTLDLLVLLVCRMPPPPPYFTNDGAHVHDTCIWYVSTATLPPPHEQCKYCSLYDILACLLKTKVTVSSQEVPILSQSFIIPQYLRYPQPRISLTREGFDVWRQVKRVKIVRYDMPHVPRYQRPCRLRAFALSPELNDDAILFEICSGIKFEVLLG